jgi:geranylgeranyl reductase family protein
MTSSRFDALVVGAGPGGSIAALVLARSGAQVVLLDKARFPRDKACGDFVGPRGLQVLADLNIEEPAGIDVGDMVVVGPTGRRVTLPCFDGSDYPGRARAMTRTVFDNTLRTAALEAGAIPFEGRADRPLGSETHLEGFAFGAANELRADFVIGADGATSHVARVAGLVEDSRVLWGFALRFYLEQRIELPVITLWEKRPWHAFPGYGWIFPSPDGMTNVGIGIGTLSDRKRGSEAAKLLPDYMAHLVELGILERMPAQPLPGRLGGWLKMGMVGTNPARGRVLLVGDAAGLVNPLQGEGIAQAMSSGMAAARSIVDTPNLAAGHYRRALAGAHLPYQGIAAAGHAALVGRPRAVAAIGRLLTAPVIGQAAAGGWGIFWNELLDGAPQGNARRIAAASTAIGQALTIRTSVARWMARNLEA